MKNEVVTTMKMKAIIISLIMTAAIIVGTQLTMQQPIAAAQTPATTQAKTKNVAKTVNNKTTARKSNEYTWFAGVAFVVLVVGLVNYNRNRLAEWSNMHGTWA